MIIRLQANQIPHYWEVIKFCAVKADNVKSENVKEYCQELFLGLLNGRYECLISTYDNKNIARLMISYAFYDHVIQEKVYVFKTLFGFTPVGDDTWSEESKKIYDYVRRIGCTRIKFTTGNKRVKQLADQYGFKVESVNYAIDLQEV